MGWARTLLLGDIGNRLDIADTEQDISSIRRDLTDGHQRDASQDEAIRRLQAENEQLELCVAALVTALERKGVLTSGEVANLVRMID
ncbi:MAG: hypothetical protein ACYTGR_14790 [Planctomycetota bacterium]|jgi:hypothetical protein